MPATIVSTANAEHYQWGGPANTDCDAWYLVKTPELNIIEELMPPGTSETPHHHVHARQFVFLLSGELTMMVEYHDFVLHAGEGLEVSPGQIHRAMNRSAAPVRFTMTSQPPSHDDRVEEHPAPSVTPPVSPTTALVLKTYRQIMTGALDRTQLTPEANAALTPDLLAQAQLLFQQLGDPAKLTLKSQTPTSAGTAYVYTGSFTTGDFQVLIEITRDNKIAGFRLAP